MRLVIAGSRSLAPTIEEIDAGVAALHLRFAIPADEPIEEVISGDAPGSDRAGAAWGKVKGIAVHHEPITAEDVARWGKYLAPKARNGRMGDRGTHALVFWDGHSGGSADMVARMVVRCKPVHVVPMRAPKRSRRTRG